MAELDILKDFYALPDTERSKININDFPVLKDFSLLPDEEKTKVSQQVGFSFTSDIEAKNKLKQQAVDEVTQLQNELLNRNKPVMDYGQMFGTTEGKVSSAVKLDDYIKEPSTLKLGYEALKEPAKVSREGWHKIWSAIEYQPNSEKVWLNFLAGVPANTLETLTDYSSINIEPEAMAMSGFFSALGKFAKTSAGAFLNKDLFKEYITVPEDKIPTIVKRTTEAYKDVLGIGGTKEAAIKHAKETMKIASEEATAEALSKPVPIGQTKPQIKGIELGIERPIITKIKSVLPEIKPKIAEIKKPVIEGEVKPQVSQPTEEIVKYRLTPEGKEIPVVRTIEPKPIEPIKQTVQPELKITPPITDVHPGIDEVKFKQIVEEQGAKYNGLLKNAKNEPEVALFTDKQTGGTLALPINDITPENVKNKIDASRIQFEQRKQPFVKPTMPIEAPKPAEIKAITPEIDENALISYVVGQKPEYQRGVKGYNKIIASRSAEDVYKSDIDLTKQYKDFSINELKEKRNKYIETANKNEWSYPSDVRIINKIIEYKQKTPEKVEVPKEPIKTPEIAKTEAIPANIKLQNYDIIKRYGKEVDKGLPIGTRKQWWELKAGQSPIYAKDLSTGKTDNYISSRKITKDGVNLYIPKANLKPGHIIQIKDTKLPKEQQNRFIQVVKPEEYTVSFKNITEQEAKQLLKEKGITFKTPSEYEKEAQLKQQRITTEKEKYTQIQPDDEHLFIGDNFTINGEKFTITKKTNDSITIKDGITKTIPNYKYIKIDKGSYKEIPEEELSTEFMAEGVAEKPTELIEVEKTKLTDRYKTYHDQAIQSGLKEFDANKFALKKLEQEKIAQQKPTEIVKPKQEELGISGGIQGFGKGAKGEQELPITEVAKPKQARPSGTGFAAPKEPEKQVKPPTPPNENEVYLNAPADFQPHIEMPELYKLAKDLMGKPPVAAKLRTNLGLFTHAEGIPISSIKINIKAFKNPIEAGKVLAHEIGHLIDWLPDNTLKRGNLIGRLHTLRNFLKHTFGNLDNKTIKNELIKLTEYWHPFDMTKVSPNYINYRKSSRELYAEAISVLFNQPEKLKEISPTFYKEFWDNVNKKPEVEQALNELYEFIGQDYNEILKQRQIDIRDMFENAEKRFFEIRNENKIKNKSLWFKFKEEFIDKNTALIDKVKELKSKNIKLNPEDNPVYYLETNNYIGGKIKNLLDDINTKVLLPAQNNKISQQDIGEYLFLKRVITERGDIANPLGQNRITAEKQLKYLLDSFNPEQKTQLEQSVSKLRSILKNLNEEANKAGLYKEDIYKQIITNENYAPFQVLDYLDDYVTPKVIHQIGTLKEIGNPFTSTILKSISLKRAIERNLVRKSIIDFMKTNYNNEISESEYKQLGKIREIKEKEGFGIIPIYESGTFKGYYVDPHIADSVNYQPRNYNSAILSTLKFLNRGWFRPVYVNLNFGFQTFNFFRDLQRSWKLNPDLKFYKILSQYIKAAPHVQSSIWGDKPSEVIKQMQQEGMMSVSYNDILKGNDEELTQAEYLLHRYGILNVDEKKKFFGILNKIEEVGNFIERLPKVAGYQARIKKLGKGLSMQEIAHEVRVYSGSPDFLRKNKGYGWTNDVFLFSNAIKEGIRGDFEGAFKNPRTRSGYWWKTASLNILPKIIMFLAGTGYFGKEIADNYKKQTEYDKTNYNTVPLGTTDNGQAIYLRIPQDEMGRLFGAMFWKAINNDKDILRSATQIGSLTAGQLPSLSPSIELLFNTMQYISGQNPYDFFKGRTILTDDEQKVRGSYGAKKMGRYYLSKLGFSMNFGYSDEKSDTTVVKTIKYSPIISRFIKITDYGIKEQQKELKGNVTTRQAERRLKKYSNKSQGFNTDIKIIK